MKTTRIVIFFVLLTLTLTLPAIAAVPTTLSYQGTLTDKAGNPINATRTVVFSLYNVATGGSSVWTETQSLTVTGGRFGAILGITTPLDVTMLSGDTWLGISVQGEPEMTPRQKLTSVAYAMKAKEAESVTSTDSIIPPGTVVAFGGTVEPAGWLFCDGRSFLMTTYPRLYSAIGKAHGSADATHFNIPNYKGRFLRGVSGSSTLDPEKGSRGYMALGGNINNNVGSVQDDQFSEHAHSYGINSGTASTNPANNLNLANNASNVHFFSNSYQTEYKGGTETRPVNAYVNWIIKY